MALFSGPIWPFVNEQAVLQSWPVQIHEDTDVWIEQRLEIVEIYFAYMFTIYTLSTLA